MDSRANNAATLVDSLQRNGNEISDSRIDDRGIQRLRRHLVGSACPCCAEASSEVLRRDISGPGEGEHRSPLPSRDLGYDMGCGPESVEPQRHAVARDHQ
jgi:hypothetical protein